MKILFILGTYLPKASANGICVMNLIHNLQECGDTVHCLCWDNIGKESDSINGVEIARVFVSKKYSADHFLSLPSAKYKLISMADKVISHFLFPLYPNHRILLSQRMKKKAFQMMAQHNYDCVVSVFQPFDALYAGYKLAKAFPKLKWITYYLDTFSGGVKPRGISQKIFFERTYHWEKKYFGRCERAIIMESYKAHYSKEKFHEFSDKIFYSDFPLLHPHSTQSIKIASEYTEIKFLLAGKIDYSMRNPTYLLSLMKIILSTVPSHFDFCGTHDWPQLLYNFQEAAGSSFTYHGKVDYHTASEMEEAADVLVSIGNSFIGAVPSKIFSYMSKKKIILHVYSNSNDSAIPYLKHYPKALLLCENDGFNCDTVCDILKFINDNLNKTIDSELITALFAENIPSFTVDIIQKCMETKL